MRTNFTYSFLQKINKETFTEKINSLQNVNLSNMLAKGQNVQQQFGTQVMKVVGFDAELIENVITQWEDQEGTIVRGKFMESQLFPTEE